MHCFVLFPFFLQYLTNAEYMTSSRPVAPISTLIITIFSSAYGANLYSRTLETILLRIWQKWYAHIFATICFIPLFIDRHNDRLLPLFRQFLLIPNRKNKFMYLTANCSTPCFNQFCWDLINTRWFTTSSFSKVNSTSKALGQALVALLCVYLSV
jgi:hypothetical protein